MKTGRVTVGEVLTEALKERKANRRDATRIRDLARSALAAMDTNYTVNRNTIQDDLAEIERTADRMDARTGRSDPSVRNATKKTARRKRGK